MPKFRQPPSIVACVIAAVAIGVAAPAIAEERAWQGDEVTGLALELVQLVHGIRSKIELADSVADVISSRRTAAARTTLGDLEKATMQLATSLKAGSTRQATRTNYELVHTLRDKLNQQATEVGFADPAIELIVKARAILVELDAYYGIE